MLIAIQAQAQTFDFECKLIDFLDGKRLINWNHATSSGDVAMEFYSASELIYFYRRVVEDSDCFDIQWLIRRYGDAVISNGVTLKYGDDNDFSVTFDKLSPNLIRYTRKYRTLQPGGYYNYGSSEHNMIIVNKDLVVACE